MAVPPETVVVDPPEVVVVEPGVSGVGLLVSALPVAGELLPRVTDVKVP